MVPCSSALLSRGHRAVIIGAGGTLGRAICQAYARAGARVYALDQDVEAAARVTANLPGCGHSNGRIDVVSLASVEESAQASFAQEGVSSLVYAAGVATTGEVISMSWDAYERLMAVNVRGAFYVAHAYGKRMLDVEGSSMAFLASTAGKHGEAGGSAYCASKFAVLGLTESFAAEVGAQGMRVNAVCPGNVDSPMLTAVAQAQAERQGIAVATVLDGYAASAAARRLVDPNEVANVCVWLASPFASGVNGESMNVDAGSLTG